MRFESEKSINLGIQLQPWKTGSSTAHLRFFWVSSILLCSSFARCPYGDIFFADFVTSANFSNL